MTTSAATLVDAARATFRDDKTLIVGTGAESTRTCLRLTKDAAQRGADAVLVVAPHYYGAAMTERRAARSTTAASPTRARCR